MPECRWCNKIDPNEGWHDQCMAGAEPIDQDTGKWVLGCASWAAGVAVPTEQP